MIPSLSVHRQIELILQIIGKKVNLFGKNRTQRVRFLLLICNATFFRDAILGIIYREKWLYPA